MEDGIVKPNTETKEGQVLCINKENTKNRKLPSWMNETNNKSETNEIAKNKNFASLTPSSPKKTLPDTRIKRTVYCMTPQEFMDHAQAIVKKSRIETTTIDDGEIQHEHAWEAKPTTSSLISSKVNYVDKKVDD